MPTKRKTSRKKAPARTFAEPAPGVNLVYLSDEEEDEEDYVVCMQRMSEIDCAIPAEEVFRRYGYIK